MEQEVAIYSDDSFGSKIAEFKCFSVHVNESSRIIAVPVENGQMSPDHKVIDPTIITVTGTIDCFDEATSNAIDKLNSMFEHCRLPRNHDGARSRRERGKLREQQQHEHRLLRRH